MALAVDFPKLNTFRFVKRNDTVPDRYHSPTYERGLFYDRGNDAKGRQDYLQPVEIGDVWGFQVNVFDYTTPPTVRLEDCAGNVWATWTDTARDTVPGRNIELTTFPAETFYFRGTFAGIANLPEGQYWMIIQLGNEANAVVEYISEPIHVAASHDDTVLLEYSDPRNIKGFIFRYGLINARAAVRVGGGVNSFRPDSADTPYRDQHYNNQIVNSTPFSTKTLYAGYGEGIADWFLEKLNHIFSCRNVAVDGEKVTKAEGAKWEVQEVEGYHPQFASISIMPARNTSSGVFLTPEPLRLYARVGFSFPFAVHSASILSGTQSTLLVSGVALDNQAEEQAMVDQIMLSPFLAGTFTYDSVNGTLDYLPDDLETYTGAYYKILPKFFSFRKEIGSPVTRPISFTGIGYEVVIDFGEGAPVAAGLAPPDIGGFSVNYNYTGAIGSTVTIRVFHQDTITVFNSSHRYLTIIDANTQISSVMERFNITNSRVTAFNANFLQPAVNSLRALRISGGGLLSVITNFNRPFAQLSTIDFGYNALITAQVDTAFISYFNSASAIPLGGLFDTKGQTPPAPPSATSQTARNGLINAYGWTVNTD